MSRAGEATPASAVIRRDLLLLALATALLFGAAVGGRDLWNPNEPTYGLAVREMAERGDWTTPTVEGRPFHEKPLLYYWLARLAALPFGVDAFAIRLPSVLAGIGLVLGTYWLGLSLAGRRRGGWAALVAATTYLVWWQARTAQMDLLLGCCVLWAVAAGVLAWERRLPSRFGWILGAVALAAGILAKGPVAVVLVGGILGGYALVLGRPRLLWSGGLIGALGGGVLLALPGLLLQGGGDGALGELLLRQNVTRFVDAWDHHQPWWYYGVNFWPDMSPWGFLLPLCLGLPATRREEGRLRRLCWIWIGVVVVFFSLSASKRSVYILPAAPAMALLVASGIERFVVGGLSGWRERGFLFVHALVGGVLLAAGFTAMRKLPDRYPELGLAGSVVFWTVALAGAAICASVAVYRLRAGWATPTLAAALLAIFAVVAVVGLPAFDRYKSARAFSEPLARFPTSVEFVAWQLWPWRASYAFYGQRRFQRIDDEASLLQRWSQGQVCCLVEGDAAKTLPDSIISEADSTRRATIGSKSVALYCSID